MCIFLGFVPNLTAEAHDDVYFVFRSVLVGGYRHQVARRGRENDSM